MKYIVLETKDGARLPIIFPEMLTHCFVAGAMQLVLDTLDPKKDLRPKQLDALLSAGGHPVVSAGFVALDVARIHGKSESLGDLESNPADAGRIVLGDAVQFMPDEMVQMLLAKLGKMRDGN
jgi:hypothetical protein